MLTTVKDSENVVGMQFGHGVPNKLAYSVLSPKIAGSRYPGKTGNKTSIYHSSLLPFTNILPCANYFLLSTSASTVLSAQQPAVNLFQETQLLIQSSLKTTCERVAVFTVFLGTQFNELTTHRLQTSFPLLGLYLTHASFL